MKQLIHSIYLLCILGVITITPFFASGQVVGKKPYYLSDLIREIKTRHQIMVAFDPAAIANIKSDPDCAQRADAIDCLEERHADLFEIVRVAEKNIMIRARFSNTAETISGSIWDAATNSPLPFAEIQCSSMNAFAVSDKDGSFQLHIPDKINDWQNEKVVVTYLGFQRVELSLADLINQSKILLKPQTFDTPLANIEGAKPTVATNESHIEMDSELLSKLKGPISGDVIRNLQLLPGVSATNDYSSAFRFRGSDEDQNLVLLGNIPLYQTGHYYNLFSIINDEAIESIKLYRNYLPATIGEATGSMLQLIPQNPIENDAQIKADVSLLTSDLFASVPIGKKIGFSLSGRTTNGNIGKGSFADFFSENADALTVNQGGGELFNRSLQPNVQFQDVLSSVRWEPNATIVLTAEYVYAQDKAVLSDGYTIMGRNGRAASTYSYKSQQDWTNNGFGSTLSKKWNNKVTSKISAYWTSFDRSDETESSLTRDRPGSSESKIDKIQFTLNDAIDDKSIAFNNFIKITGATNIQAGYQYQLASVDYFIDRRKNDIEFVNRTSSIHSIYANGKIESDSKTVFELGFRTAYSSLAENIYFSPRIQFSRQLSDVVKLKSALGRYSQQLRTINILSGNNAYKTVWTLSENNEVPALNTTSFMLGGNWINELFTMDIEFYHNSDNNVMQELIPEQMNQSQQQLATLNPKLFIGKGRRYGMDILLKRENKFHTSIISYSLSKSESAFDQYKRASWVAAADDRRHEFNWQHIQHFGKFSVFGTLIFASANPQFQFTQNQQSDRLDEYARNTSYQRMDFGLDYNFKIGKCDLVLGTSVFNAFNRQNTASVRYARVDQFQDQQRSSFFTETISLLDRTFNVRLQMTLK